LRNGGQVVGEQHVLPAEAHCGFGANVAWGRCLRCSEGCWPHRRTRFRGLPASLRRFRDRLVAEAGRGRVATGRVA
jgi:hypothetical protein